MAMTFGDAQSVSSGQSADYERGWREASEAAAALIQRAVDEWFDRGDIAHAAGLTQLRDVIQRQKPE